MINRLEKLLRSAERANPKERLQVAERMREALESWFHWYVCRDPAELRTRARQCTDLITPEEFEEWRREALGR